MKSVFAPLDEVLSHCGRHAGIADISTTYGHIRFREECKKANVKPIYGVRIRVTDEHPKGTRSKRYQNCEMSFIAKNTKGLQEIYGLVDLAHKQFYQFPKITYKQLNKTSNNIVVLSGISPEIEKIKREVFLSLSPDLPKAIVNCGLKPVACCDNYFPEAKDKTQYETFTSDQWTMERKSTPMHILTDKEWLKIYPDHKEALTRRDEIAKECAGVELPIAPMVKYDVKDSADYLKRLCKAGIKTRGISMNGTYKARLKRELKVIKEKDFSDYFLVVCDLVEYCKKIMPVGPARGSSAGSLVCYLIGITEVDPIPYGLIFERFIDINRTDLPDIDCDFENQEVALRYLQKIYGSDCVAQLANINKLQPKSTLIRASKALSIHPLDVEEFKESIEDRPEGDDRSNKAILDSFDSKLGVELLKQHPNLYHCHTLEGHPSHLGIHAAGIIVCPQPLNRFCGINSRTTKHVAMIDKRDAEKINLLKIDALGLTTLSVLKDVCLQLHIPFRKIYDIPLDNKKAYDLINSGNLPGIFQMEGSALQKLSKGMKVKNIEDLAALSALCRPGPLGSGAAELFIKQHSGKEAVKYLAKGKALKAITKNTLGNIVYQEQIMQIVREIGGMSWEDVIKVRKLMGKSQGDEAFGKYKDVFIQGAIKSGMKEEDCIKLWDAMKNFGKYGFNKSHAVAYAIITYLTAYFKANNPLEFAVAVLNNTSNDQTSLKILRDLKERSGINYICDPENARSAWSVKKGELIAGLVTYEGIAAKSAKVVHDHFRHGKACPPGTLAKVGPEARNIFHHLYPCKTVYKKYFKKKWGAAPINKIKKAGEYVFIGMLTKRDLKDMNDQEAVARRKGEKVKGPSAYVSMVFEDDTGTMNASISRFQFEEISKAAMEDTQVNKDWFVMYGKYVKEKYERFYIEDIKRITKIY